MVISNTYTKKAVTPTPTPTPFEYKVITTYVDENGRINYSLKKNGEQPSKELSGYESGENRKRRTEMSVMSTVK